MLNICIISSTLFAISALLLEKNVFNPITIFCGLWAIIVFLSSLNLYTLNIASDETYSWILTGVISFTIGYCVYKVGKTTFKIKDSSNLNLIQMKQKNKKIRYHLLYSLSILCIIYIFYSMIKLGISVTSIVTGLQAIGDTISRQNGVDSSGLINAISFLIINPLFLSLTVFEAIDYWFGNRDKKLLFFIIVMTVGRIFISGGRQALIQFIVVMVICASFNINESKTKHIFSITKKSLINKLGRILVLAIGIGVFLLLTMSKTTAVLKTIYLDFAMQPVMLQTWTGQLYSQHAYGFASLFGFVHPFVYIGKNLLQLFSNMPIFFSDIYSNIQNTFLDWVSIGTNLQANAYTSIFWYLYYDGRIYGIILGMFLLGYLSAKLYIKAMLTRNVKAIANYLIIALTLIYSFTDMEFYKASFILGWLYLNLLLLRTERSMEWGPQRKQ
ncbi:O-antigen polymerase [Lactococcus lactis]|uniref:O-antigen polymerase n=1 Tax=Lactococcus lactis subsp. lactis TaxID=1360 RepID=A0AAC9W6B5_LACLL|nr:O-antigen polymerase [Lactococcus lactis]ARD94856.1 O-antigen polymerase [Lactococcus lactis subsp. lactis]AZS27651.2 O-antigen polymerase [Lactococcus lactis subsp. lactis]MRK42561.1 oligosaccharide repeat unit polymerase [Lactococcus lactis subsp. lactis]